ncbi:MAG: pcp [Polaromonas sp.]|nr:pcp [Polaromonas sp.]
MKVLDEGAAVSIQPKVLLAGFDAFGGLQTNPSGESVLRLHGETVAGHLIVGAQLSTTFSQAPLELAQWVLRVQPVLVICVGMADSRHGFSVEQVAINLSDARIPDNQGHQPLDEPAVAGAPAAYFSTLPVKAIVQTLQDAGLAAEVSYTAGTFVCNHVFFKLMHSLSGSRQKGQAVRGGFIHVPGPGSADAPADLSIDQLMRGLRLAVECALITPVYCAVRGGSLG